MKYNKFKDQLGSWGPELQEFIESKECDEIYEFLKNESKSGKVITPVSENTFRAFKECPFDKLKAVIVLMDPYPTVKNGVLVADGIPMSCSNTGVMQPSLKLFYEGIESDIYGGMNLHMIKDPDLTYLSNEGVLLLNSSLTTQVGTTGAHRDLWMPFNEYLFTKVLHNKNIPIIFCGKQALELEKYTSTNHTILTCEHPVAASYRGGKWNHNNIFSKTNKLVGEDIQWVKVYKEKESLLIT